MSPGVREGQSAGPNAAAAAAERGTASPSLAAAFQRAKTIQGLGSIAKQVPKRPGSKLRKQVLLRTRGPPVRWMARHEKKCAGLSRECST
ncbi:hypothetical protein WJX84_001646 [Apatococcus fuscideae]|uniref:Uncharacterized protein n=1 Tax=Apatococcus fuscideae TaxID=2026836 RepID=A0AAW1T7N5_9CHLO